jgi:Uma2 family endonuclease
MKAERMLMSMAPEHRRLSVAEYVVFERDSRSKHEFYRGELFAMAGGTIRHNDISGNIYHALRNRLKGTNCRPYASDQRVSVKPADLYTYTDTVVICGPVSRDEDDRDAITNPRVIFEVLSKSTENYDRGKKWEFYQQLDSLREYLIVSQEESKITRYYRDEGGKWYYKLVSGLDQNLEIASLACSLPLTDIYDNVTFGPEEIDARPA